MKLISESNPRIVERIKMYFSFHNINGGEFDRYKVATYLLENFEDLKQDISEETIKKIGSLIQRVNDLLPFSSNSNGHVLEKDSLNLPDPIINNRPKITM
jgi:predicted house-cleaning noncanonical NTP pyrophosphatase (MazG superfamily)